jgi:diguanylate cyclase (GGDEF)-like protein
MKIPDVPISSDGQAGKILLVGDINKAFFDADNIPAELCEISESIPDAVNAAAKNNFKAIGVVMVDMSARLSSALKALRDTNTKAKIILLAQMYEEPIARQFVSPSSNGTNVADDYLICPIQLKTLLASIATLRGTNQVQAEPALTATINEKLERRIKQLEILATTDDLTGLRNRRYIWEFSQQILEHAKKENGRVTLLVFDIDNFKHYNDVYGHQVGDKILKQAAVLIQRCCRAHDVVGRIGGDEFAVVFWDDPQPKTLEIETERRAATRSGQDHPKEVIFIAKRFISELEKAELNLLGSKGEGVLTISGGLAGFPHDGSTAQKLFHEADKALLQAKRSGKNRIYLVGQPQSDIADIK